MTLFYIYSNECPVCAQQTPEVAKFAKANPGVEVKNVDPLEDLWPFTFDPPEVLPAFVLQRGGLPPRTVTMKAKGDIFKAKEIKAWVFAR